MRKTFASSEALRIRSRTEMRYCWYPRLRAGRSRRSMQRYPKQVPLKRRLREGVRLGIRSGRNIGALRNRLDSGKFCLACAIDPGCRQIQEPEAVRDRNDVCEFGGTRCRRPAGGGNVDELSVAGPLYKARSGADPPLSVVPHRYGEGPTLRLDAASDGRPFSVRGNAADFDNLSVQNASQPAPVLLNPRQVVGLAAQLPKKHLPRAEAYQVSPSHQQARRCASIDRREEDLRLVSHQDGKCDSRLVARHIIVDDALAGKNRIGLTRCQIRAPHLAHVRRTAFSQQIVQPLAIRRKRG